MDGESCINVVSSVIINKVGLKAEPHPRPYKVSWSNEVALNVTQRCFVPIEFTVYKDKIWCDVITMNVGQIILGIPWLFDPKKSIILIPCEVTPVIDEFADVFPEDLPDQLPPMRDIQHACLLYTSPSPRDS